jgi:hypothetical protein
VIKKEKTVGLIPEGITFHELATPLLLGEGNPILRKLFILLRASPTVLQMSIAFLFLQTKVLKTSIQWFGMITCHHTHS